jgi:hypothetical protein
MFCYFWYYMVVAVIVIDNQPTKKSTLESINNLKNLVSKCKLPVLVHFQKKMGNTKKISYDFLWTDQCCRSLQQQQGEDTVSAKENNQ